MAYCDRCQRYFQTSRALDEHERHSGNHHICNDCGLDFSTWVGLKEHYVQSPRHSYCQPCNTLFPSDQSLKTHYHSQHHYCEKCNKLFVNDHGLSEHYRQLPNHSYCVECKRDFQNDNNLRAHMNSSTHKPKAFICPGARCGQGFVSRSALVLHLESGSCPSGATRAIVNERVRQYDTSNVITNPSRLLTGGDIQYSANTSAWNGCASECYLCHSTYSSLRALNQHLASPKHQQKIYFCPLDTCRVQFTTLSALLQHIESERCGVAKFKVVQNTLNGLMSSRMLTF
ncbi:hypothetical protein BDZ89DRAFT_1072869 [Hymenopellis radicata]|nr:hypothetical protein BDZ89DRAFT_1072869 [Hymenopellis radicata]